MHRFLSSLKNPIRDFALPCWSEPSDVDLMERYPDIVDYDGFEVGDCTFHHGWCLHRYVPYINLILNGIDCTILYNIRQTHDVIF